MIFAVTTASAIAFYALCELVLHKMRPSAASEASALSFWLGLVQSIGTFLIVVFGIIVLVRSL